jgi:hypothetical protein
VYIKALDDSRDGASEKSDDTVLESVRVVMLMMNYVKHENYSS